jgi:hypothetical protein
LRLAQRPSAGAGSGDRYRVRPALVHPALFVTALSMARG